MFCYLEYTNYHLSCDKILFYLFLKRKKIFLANYTFNQKWEESPIKYMKYKFNW